MKSIAVDCSFRILQDGIFSNLNNVSKDYPLVGRVSCLIVAPLDICIETVKQPVKVIEALAIAAMNLFGSFIHVNFYDAQCTVKDAIFNTELAIKRVITIPVALATAPIKLIYQLFMIAYNPKEATTFNPYTYPDEKWIYGDCVV